MYKHVGKPAASSTGLEEEMKGCQTSMLVSGTVLQSKGGGRSEEAGGPGGGDSGAAGARAGGAGAGA